LFAQDNKWNDPNESFEGLPRGYNLKRSGVLASDARCEFAASVTEQLRRALIEVTLGIEQPAP
jgi:hypothetical protein